MAAALGIEPIPAVDEEPTDVVAEVGERDRAADAETKHEYEYPNPEFARFEPAPPAPSVEPDPALRLKDIDDWLRERDARIKQKRLKKFQWTRDPLHHEALILPNYSGTVIPNLIARAQLYDAVMLYGDKGFKKRFDRAFGLGAANRVLSRG